MDRLGKRVKRSLFVLLIGQMSQALAVAMGVRPRPNAKENLGFLPRKLIRDTGRAEWERGGGCRPSVRFSPAATAYCFSESAR
jgi:hypothetical protein